MSRTPTPVIAHVSMPVIRHNAKHGTTYPVLTVKVPGLGTRYAHEVRGYATMVDSNAQGRNKLSCGARVWIEYSKETFEFIDEPLTWDELRTLLEGDREAASLIRELEADPTATACPLSIAA